MKQEKLVTHKRSRMKVSESHSGLRVWKQKLLFFLKKSALLKQLKMILNLKLIHPIYNSIKKIKYNISSLLSMLHKTMIPQKQWLLMNLSQI